MRSGVFSYSSNFGGGVCLPFFSFFRARARARARPCLILNGRFCRNFLSLWVFVFGGGFGLGEWVSGFWWVGLVGVGWVGWMDGWMGGGMGD